MKCTRCTLLDKQWQLDMGEPMVNVYGTMLCGSCVVDFIEWLLDDDRSITASLGAYLKPYSKHAHHPTN